MTHVASVWGRPKNLGFSPSVPTLLAQVWGNLAWFVWMQGLHWPLAEAQFAHQLKSFVGEAVLSAWLLKALFLSLDPDSRESPRLHLLPSFQCLVWGCLLFQCVISATHVLLTGGKPGSSCCRMNYPGAGWNHRWSHGGWSSKFKLSASLSTVFKTLHKLVKARGAPADKLQNEHSSDDKVKYLLIR